MENFGKFMAIVMALIIVPIIRAFVTVKLWAWFVIPAFGLGPIKIVETIGLMFLLGYLADKDAPNIEDNFWEVFGIALIKVVLTAFFTLLSGFVVKSFI